MMFLIDTFLLGLHNLALHKLRSLLTVLGIIFGVASVITMVAIGEGNKKKALADIQQLGAQNIIVRSVKPPEPEQQGTGSRQMMIDYGIRRLDQRRIEQTVGGIERIVPLKKVGSRVSQGRNQASAEVYGTTPALRDATRLRIARGRYLTEQDMTAGSVNNVAVLGAEVAVRLFPLEDPLEGVIRVDQQAFRVVGVLQPVGLAGGAGTALVGRDLNFDVHIPLAAARMKFGDMQISRKSGAFEATNVEISEMIIQVEQQDAVLEVSDQVKLVLDKEHKTKGDVTVVVPLELLQQAERTQRMFNALMVAIASISLVVGGIGIMNIMLAAVTERTREIGIRRALGATRHHIIMQFLVETTVLSGLGGLLGIAFGVGATLALTIAHSHFPAIEQPSITAWSVMVSFIVAASVGIVFGLYPAVQAARQDPIVALRHD